MIIENKKIILTIDEIVTYQHCPMKYYYKYVFNKFEQKYINIHEKFYNDVKKTLYSMFTIHKMNKTFSLAKFKKIWGANFIGNRTNEQLIFSDTSQTQKNKFNKEGVDILLNIYENFSDRNFDVMLVNTDYNYSITENLIIKGKWDLVIKNNAGANIMLDFNNNYNHELEIRKNVKTTLDYYSFKELFKVTELKLKYFDLNKNKTIPIIKTKNDHYMMRKTIIEIARAIKLKIFYPNQTSNRCNDCQFKTICNEKANMDYFENKDKKRIVGNVW